MHKLLFRVVLASLTLTVSGQAVAEGRVCSPKVDWTGLGPQGDMLVALRGMGVTTFCNVNGTVNTARGPVTSETCKTWYAGFTTAQAKGMAVTMWFDFGAAAAPQCDAFGYDWGLSPRYPYLLAFN